MARIVYSRGFPYGAPLAMIRGGATRDPDVKAYLRREGFRWDGTVHAWTTFLDRSDLVVVLRALRDEHGCQVDPKADLPREYLIDLDSPVGARP